MSRLTNGDKIRHLTDEELVPVMLNSGACPPDIEENSDLCWLYHNGSKHKLGPCGACWLDWLGAEVSDNG